APCYALSHDVEQGAAIERKDLVKIACVAGPPAGMVRFQRSSGTVRASSDLRTGTRIGAVSPLPPPDVAKGAQLTLVSRSGPVRVNRSVVALQAGHTGNRIFVMDEERNITSVPLALDTPGGLE